MLNSRVLLTGLAGMALVPAFAEDLPHRTKHIWDNPAEVPSAKVIRGHPNLLQFENGPTIPLDKHAFLTLWEGPSF